MAMLLVAGLAGCSTDNAKISDVKIDAVHQIYAVTHDAEGDASQAYARFRIGGSTGTNVQLTGGTSVHCNNVPLGEADFFGKCYTNVLKGFPGNYDFAFVGPDGKTFNNSITLRPVDFADFPERLSRSKATRIPFAGPPLQEGESVHLVISPVRLNKAPDPFADVANQFKQGGALVASLGAKGTGATDVAWTPEQLKNMKSGEVNVQWMRNASGTGLHEAGPAGGQWSAVYRSKARVVTLED